MGGGVMRTAAKVAGIGSVMHGGIRGSPAVPSSGKSMRTASIPVTAGVSPQSLKGSDAGVIEKQRVEATVDDFVDWQVVGGEDELVMSAGEPMPRVVFGPAPSFKEAKEATAVLKDALDKAYLSSPKITELEEPTAADKVSGQSLFSNPGAETESVLVTRTSVPQHAYRAFELLSRSPEAQNVVASIASDPNVWNAMIENSAVKQFMESQKKLNQDPYDSASDSVSILYLQRRSRRNLIQANLLTWNVCSMVLWIKSSLPSIPLSAICRHTFRTFSNPLQMTMATMALPELL